MIKKRIQLDFANPSIRAIDFIQDIRKAAEYAGLNLYSRHDVRLQYPMPTSDNRVEVEIHIPESIAETFAVGNHLRGISSYLLRKHGDRYQKYLVGNRLLIYTEITSDKKNEMPLVTEDRFEAVASFIRLLEQTDEDAAKKINRIIDILKEDHL